MLLCAQLGDVHVSYFAPLWTQEAPYLRQHLVEGLPPGAHQFVLDVGNLALNSLDGSVFHRQSGA